MALMVVPLASAAGQKPVRKPAESLTLALTGLSTFNGPLKAGATMQAQNLVATIAWKCS